MVDAFTLDFAHYSFGKRELVAAVVYFVVGGAQGMMVFPKDSEIATIN